MALKFDPMAILTFAAKFLGLKAVSIKGMLIEEAAVLIGATLDNRARKHLDQAVSKLASDGTDLHPPIGEPTKTITDKDGIPMSVTQFFVHEAQYRLYRTAGFPGEAADFFRDLHEHAVWAATQNQIVPNVTTPLEAVKLVLDAEVAAYKS